MAALRASELSHLRVQNGLGRHADWSDDETRNLCRPFRADSFIDIVPRALPWAGLLSPFGAQTRVSPGLIGLGCVNCRPLRA